LTLKSLGNADVGADDAEKCHGLPVSLQLVGRRFEDEKVIAVLQYLEEQIGLPFVEFP